MSLFDLFRGFFGAGLHGWDGRRDPFFDGMTHDDDEEEDCEDGEDGLYHDGSRGGQDPFDDAWRFGFSLGPNGMRLDEPQVFGQIFREMEEIFSQFGSLGRQPGFGGHFGVPSIAPPSEDGPERGGGCGPGRNSLRDFMLKSPHGGPTAPPPGDPRPDAGPSGAPCYPSPPFHHRTPFSKFSDIWRGRAPRGQEEERKEDRDLDSQVSSGGLDQILTPPRTPFYQPRTPPSSPPCQPRTPPSTPPCQPSTPPCQPRTRSYFQSVTVTKVVRPDGSVEERRTVRDGQGNEETTVTQTGGSGRPQDQTLLPGGQRASSDLQDDFSDLQDDFSVFSKFFGGPRR